MPSDNKSVAFLIRSILRYVPAGEQEEAFTHLAEVLDPEEVRASTPGDVRALEALR